jgi:hypothetical protein
LYPKADAWHQISGGAAGRRISSPPTCFFGFGTKLLECMVTKMDVSETHFNSFLAPVRAKISITLTVIEEKDNMLNIVNKQHRNALAATGLQNIRPF